MVSVTGLPLFQRRMVTARLRKRFSKNLYFRVFTQSAKASVFSCPLHEEIPDLSSPIWPVDAACGKPSVVYRRRGWNYGVIRLAVQADLAVAGSAG